jgi:hypothetical protein
MLRYSHCLPHQDPSLQPSLLYKKYIRCINRFVAKTQQKFLLYYWNNCWDKGNRYVAWGIDSMQIKDPGIIPEPGFNF